VRQFLLYDADLSLFCVIVQLLGFARVRPPTHPHHTQTNKNGTKKLK
jgi:hypothetical protein